MKRSGTNKILPNNQHATNKPAGNNIASDEGIPMVELHEAMNELLI